MRKKKCYICKRDAGEWFWWPELTCDTRNPVCRECGTKFLTPDTIEDLTARYDWKGNDHE